MNKEPIEFYFDFSSPYAFLTSTWIDELAKKHDRFVKWTPIMLGVVFKTTGMKPLFHQPLRGDYGMRDFKRTGRLLGLQAIVPKEFPYVSLMVSRAFYWLEKHDSERAVPFAKAVFRRYFLAGIAPTADVDLCALANEVGADVQALTAGVVDLEVKERLKMETQNASDKGVFGAPFVIVDAEPFWGNDRKDQIDAWLESGGW